MAKFRMARLNDRESRVDRLAAALERFELQPSYQRQSDVWGEEKRQLFIDSLINGYDVPKLYFHKLPAKTRSPSRSFAIVDGKQRLEAIHAFVNNQFALSPDFVDVEADITDEPGVAAGATFSDLTVKHPLLAGKLTERQLDIVVIETDDLEIIEELFCRLNEAVPLNAPEKRNAFGGAMPPVIRRLVHTHVFFRDRLPIENTRYRQFDLATKFLYLAARDAFVPTKKRDLDDFVRAFKVSSSSKQREAKSLGHRVSSVLDLMARTFEEQDVLLTSVGLTTLYFVTFLRSMADGPLRTSLSREKLVEFDHIRRANRLLLHKQQSAIASGRAPRSAKTVRQDFMIFDRLMQSPNDGQALEYRFRILEAFLKGRQFHRTLPDSLLRKVGA